MFFILPPVSCVYEKNVKKLVDNDEFNENYKMLGFLWKDSNINSSEKVQKIIVFISNEKNFLDKLNGICGSSSSVSQAYWTLVDDISKSFTTKTGKSYRNLTALPQKSSKENMVVN